MPIYELGEPYIKREIIKQPYTVSEMLRDAYTGMQISRGITDIREKIDERKLRRKAEAISELRNWLMMGYNVNDILSTPSGIKLTADLIGVRESSLKDMLSKKPEMIEDVKVRLRNALGLIPSEQLGIGWYKGLVPSEIALAGVPFKEATDVYRTFIPIEKDVAKKYGITGIELDEKNVLVHPTIAARLIGTIGAEKLYGLKSAADIGALSTEDLYKELNKTIELMNRVTTDITYMALPAYERENILNNLRGNYYLLIKELSSRKDVDKTYLDILTGKTTVEEAVKELLKKRGVKTEETPAKEKTIKKELEIKEILSPKTTQQRTITPDIEEFWK